MRRHAAGCGVHRTCCARGSRAAASCPRPGAPMACRPPTSSWRSSIGSTRGRTSTRWPRPWGCPPRRSTCCWRGSGRTTSSRPKGRRRQPRVPIRVAGPGRTGHLQRTCSTSPPETSRSRVARLLRRSTPSHGRRRYLPRTAVPSSLCPPPRSATNPCAPPCATDARTGSSARAASPPVIWPRCSDSPSAYRRGRTLRRGHWP